MLNWTPSNRPTAMNVSERLDFILRSVLYFLEEELGIDDCLDDWFVQNGHVSNAQSNIESLVCKLLFEKFEPSRGLLKPSRPAPEIPTVFPKFTNRASTSAKRLTSASSGSTPESQSPIFTKPNRIKVERVNHRISYRRGDDDSSFEDYLYERDYERMNFAPNQVLTLAEDYKDEEFSVKKEEQLIFLEQSESWIKVKKIGKNSETGWINLEYVSFVN